MRQGTTTTQTRLMARQTTRANPREMEPTMSTIRNNKRKGASAETTVAQWLKSRWPLAERRHLNGNLDRGDITGVPSTVIEVKSGANISIPAWLKELDVEMINDNAEHGCLMIKPKGKTKGEDYWCVTRPDIFFDLLKHKLDS